MVIDRESYSYTVLKRSMVREVFEMLKKLSIKYEYQNGFSNGFKVKKYEIIDLLLRIS